MTLIRRLLIFCGIIYFAEGARQCSDTTKAHLTRCDMYYKCTVLPSDNIIWLAQNCPSGLIYDVKFGHCVLPGDDWECQLEVESSRSSRDDDDNIYGINNLGYINEKVKGYDGDEDKITDGAEEDLDNDNDNENVSITMSNNGTMSFESNVNMNDFESNKGSNDFESSGDGEEENDQNGDSIENKSGYVPIPNNANGLISSQLQRLSQLVRKVNTHQTTDINSDDLNQYLALHKLYHQKYTNNMQADPVPQNNLIDEDHMKQILDLQKKLNNLAKTRDTYSTPSTPVKYTISGNGMYPADATTVHIKATNGVSAQPFPSAGYSSSQIVVNRPGGSVVFRLPNNNQQQQQKIKEKKPDGQISEETLKTLLELSKQMTNHAPNTPNFLHSLPSSSPGYVQPIIQPVVYNFPWDQLSLASLLTAMDRKKSDKIQSDEQVAEPQSMEKISSVSGSFPATPNAFTDPDDTAPTTIVHNHIPITITNPHHTDSIVKRYHASTTTARPMLMDRYDSYGTKKPTEHSDLNNYYPYPPFPENTQKNAFAQQMSTAQNLVSYPSPFSTQHTNYAQDSVEQPHFVQISHSKPDRYVPSNALNVYPSMVNAGGRPIPTFASVNGGYTQKFYSSYTPQPQLDDSNIGIVQFHPKPYPTMQPVNYVQIATTSNYADAPVREQPHITDKIDHFADLDDNDDGERFESNEDDYTNQNVEQNSNENVMNLLANYNTQIKSDSLNSIESSEKKHTYNYNTIPGHTNHKQFVNLNGNFMSLETYQETIEPFLQKNPAVDAQIEVLTCATGVRQANSTDCTRYFVCNEKTGKVLSYSCPPYTAFNGDTKICNAETYSRCFTDTQSNKRPSNTKMSQQELQLSIIEANRIKSEAMKAQQLAHLIKLETDKLLNSAHHAKYAHKLMNGGKSTTQMMEPTQAAQVVTPTQSMPKAPRPQHKPHANVSAQKQVVKSPKPAIKKPRGKRKIPCKFEGKLVDNLSQHHYFLCFKDQTKTMRARRMQCPAKLIFCPNSLVCTATERCMNKHNRL